MKKDKTIGGVLALIGGALGLHWFYVGRIIRGLLVLAITLAGFWLQNYAIIAAMWLMAAYKSLEWWYIMDWHQFNTKFNRKGQR